MQRSYRRFICSITVFFIVQIAAVGSFSAVAAPTQQTESLSFLPVLASLLVVLAVVIGLALVLRKMNVGFANSRAIQIISAMSLGTKERIVVVEIGGKQHVLGVTAHQINHLFELDEQIETTSASSSTTDPQAPLTFQKILQGFSDKRAQQK
jgi:flagellar protein FliO/FliZ